MIYSGDVQRIEPAPVAGPAPLDVAHLILAGFDRHYALFRYSAQRAKSLFESGDWHGMQRLSRERIEYYDMRVRECATQLDSALRGSDARTADGSRANGSAALSEAQTAFWQAVKQEFVGLLADHRQPECAETFFNSVSCRILHRDYFHNDFLFVRPAIATDYLDSRIPSYRVYYPVAEGLHKSLIRMVADFGLAVPYADLPRDARLLARAAVRQLRGQLPRHAGPRLASDCQIQVLGSLFFRNTGAYIVGRLINQGTVYPFAVALRRNPAGQVCLDALLLGADDLSTLFSFTRAYFLVDMETPAAVVNFLASLLPRKPKAELYTMLGLQKQGKTLFYRDFLHHLTHSRDAFDIAPGIRGMVMCVFTLPSYPYVFKLIKDRIDKDGMDHATVRRKYQMVKLHDRVGRMADTWEYSQVALPRSRFAPPVAGRTAPAGPQPDRGKRRYGGDPPCLHRAAHDAAEPLPAPRQRPAARGRRARVRRRHPPARHGQYLPGRHAVQELRRHPPGPGRVLRLRRNPAHDGDEFPRHSAGAQRRSRAFQRTLVRGGPQ